MPGPHRDEHQPNDVEFGNGFIAQHEPWQGIHRFTLRDGTQVTAVAVDTWQRFMTELDGMPPSLQPGYIVSPELISVADLQGQYVKGAVPTPEQLLMTRRVVEERLEAVQAQSRKQPNATMLLGTPSWDLNNVLRNSVAVIVNGEITGYIDKGPSQGAEASVFAPTARREQAKLPPGHAVLICYDILSVVSSILHGDGQSMLAPGTRSIILVSRWGEPLTGIPLSPGAGTPHQRRQETLQGQIRLLFERVPGLHDVVVVDRTATADDTPYTAHYRRLGPDMDVAAEDVVV